MEVTNPFDGALLGHVPNCGRVETKRAITSAANAFDQWRALAAKQRCDYLQKWAALIDQNKEDLARLMNLEQGKPITE